jgi:hypothetical protein
MTLKQYLVVMILATIMCWISWGMVIVNIDPFTTGSLGFIFFYISLFLSLLGTISIGSFFMYNHFSKRHLPMFKYVKKSFHNAVVFSGITTGLLFLQANDLLHFWNFTIFLLVVALIVSFNMSTNQNRLT